MRNQKSSPPEFDDAAWFEAFYSSTYRTVVAFVRRRAPLDAVDDIVADVYLAAWKHIGRLRSGDNPRLWLQQTAMNRLLNQQRGKTRHVKLVGRAKAWSSLASERTDPAEVVMERQDVDVVGEALATLSPRDQEMLRLVAFEELSHAEIGWVMGINQTRVRGILYRARKRLESALEQIETRQSPSSGDSTGSATPDGEGLRDE